MARPAGSAGAQDSRAASFLHMVFRVQGGRSRLRSSAASSRAYPPVLRPYIRVISSGTSLRSRAFAAITNPPPRRPQDDRASMGCRHANMVMQRPEVAGPGIPQARRDKLPEPLLRPRWRSRRPPSCSFPPQRLLSRRPTSRVPQEAPLRPGQIGNLGHKFWLYGDVLRASGSPQLLDATSTGIPVPAWLA